MCMIVDANVAGELLQKTPDAVPVLNWLLTSKGGALVIGGKLTTELTRTGFRQTLIVLDQAGRLRRQDDAKIKDVASQIEKKGMCRSDDAHIIATAIVSGCRLVFTRDKNLQKDIKNRDVLNPSGSIYSSQDHTHLLTPCKCK